MQYQRSSSLFRSAQAVIPGGVNSPVRAFKAVGGAPVYVEKAKGAYLYDVDGNTLIDYISSWGPMILGHAFEPVIEAVKKRAESGTSFGMPTELETQIAELAVQMVPNIDKIRMVNSGTEACMSAIRLARGYTVREKIIKFVGCYHGHSDAFLIQAGSGAMTFGIPNSPGVTQGTARDTLLAQYNDLESVKNHFKQYPDKIAAVIVEPVAGNMGCIPPQTGFMEGLRKLCDDHQTLLIFDEVMTGFRLAKGGVQELSGITPDLCALGKVIGGGLPVGAFGGRGDIMDHLAPDGPVYQAGTLSGNPVAMAAGLAQLRELEKQNGYQRLEEIGQRFEDGVRGIIRDKGLPYRFNRAGSMWCLYFGDAEIINVDSVQQGDFEAFRKFFWSCLERGIYLAPSPYETGFLSLAHTESDIDETLEVFADCLA